MFFLIHRNVLINWRHFIGFNTAENKVILAGYIEKQISRRRKPQFKKKYADYLSQSIHKNDVL